MYIDYMRRVELAAMIAARLAEAYKLRPVDTANACDETLDRSGNLLGWLREYSRAATSTERRESPE